MRAALIRLRLYEDEVGLHAERLRAAYLGEALGHSCDHVVDLAALLLDQGRARRAANLPGGKELRARAIHLQLDSFDLRVAEARAFEQLADGRFVVEAVGNV